MRFNFVICRPSVIIQTLLVLDNCVCLFMTQEELNILEVNIKTCVLLLGLLLGGYDSCSDILGHLHKNLKLGAPYHILIQQASISWFYIFTSAICCRTFLNISQTSENITYFWVLQYSSEPVFFVYGDGVLAQRSAIGRQVSKIFKGVTFFLFSPS